ncbi:MAG TPA: TIGR03560 family F420-dependent LLM class oxidoreductase [Acidimicrobiia bacterium]|nr:TIGR03560 family F420-dependent LLM class oxidoreductase [Acidimicrobiia bacterium]
MPRYAIKTPPHHGNWSDYLDVWRAADEVPLFESAWNFDHFYPTSEPFDGPCLEGWTMLAALAQATKRLQLGCMVSAVPYRHPAVIANMAATIDEISGGRFVLGLGAGWHEMEAIAYGIPLGSMTERMDRFEEAVEVVLSLLSKDETTFHGHFYQLENARCEPKGPQAPPPLVIGGTGRRRTLRVVARFAQMWDSLFVPPEEWPELHQVLVEHCQVVGRDPNEITTVAHVRFDGDADPAEIAAKAAAYHEVGVDLVVFPMFPPLRATNVERLAEAIARS